MRASTRHASPSALGATPTFGSASKLGTTPTFGAKTPEKEDHRAKLVEFYQKHNPRKLDTVDATLKKYAGREHERREAQARRPPQDVLALEVELGPVRVGI